MNKISSTVRIKPAGSVPFQNFYGDQLDSMHIIETKKSIYFREPIENKYEKNSPTNSIPSFSKRDVVNRRWSLMAAIGPLWGLYEAKQVQSFDNPQTSIQLGVRYHPLKNDPHKGDALYEFAYYHSSLIGVYSNYGNPGNKIKSSLNIYAFNFGLTMQQNQSYYYLLVGMAIHSLGDGTSLGLSDSYLGLRVGLGAVFHITENYNLIINMLGDITYTGKRRDMFGQEHATSAGGITLIQAGLMFDL